MPLPLSLLMTMAVMAPSDPVKEWQVRYDQIVGGMKKRDPKPFLKVLHKDYTEMSDGIVSGLAKVKTQLPGRMDTVAQFGQKPKVVAAKVVGNTAQVTFYMTYKATKTEAKKKVVFESTSKLYDTWVKVGSTWQLYRSAVLESKTTRNGKVLKRPGS